MIEKKDLLPIVQEEVVRAVQEEFRQRGYNYVKETLERIKQDNPLVGFYIDEFVKRNQNLSPLLSPSLLIEYATIFVYRLIESQAEAEKMNREFGF